MLYLIIWQEMEMICIGTIEIIKEVALIGGLKTEVMDHPGGQPDGSLRIIFILVKGLV